VQPIPLHYRHNEIVRTLLLALAATVLAQDSSFSTNVDVVTLFATVRDANAQPAKNLTRDDLFFSKTASRKPSAISLANQTSRSPLVSS
jgi:hypothetical protein